MKQLTLSSLDSNANICGNLEHVCNEVYFVEDNPTILNKYEKLMKK